MLTSLMLLIAAAAGQDVAPAPAAATAMVDGDKIICKSERPVGTNLSSRTCKTKAKWAADRDRSREDIQDDINARAGTWKPDGWYLNNGSGVPGPGWDDTVTSTKSN